jgi:hypothetical protein
MGSPINFSRKRNKNNAIKKAETYFEISRIKNKTFFKIQDMKIETTSNTKNPISPITINFCGLEGIRLSESTSKSDEIL